MKKASDRSSHLPLPSVVLLEPRKSPVQARSAASVDAILEATIQVLLSVGKERLTTTRVAARAGVSVGTLYQYFPNKSALMQAVLKRHLEQVAEAVERVCREQEGNSLTQIGPALINAFLDAKMKDPKNKCCFLCGQLRRGRGEDRSAGESTGQSGDCGGVGQRSRTAQERPSSSGFDAAERNVWSERQTARIQYTREGIEDHARGTDLPREHVPGSVFCSACLMTAAGHASHKGFLVRQIQSSGYN
jgi:AcrR family transcriptional regulator